MNIRRITAFIVSLSSVLILFNCKPADETSGSSSKTAVGGEGEPVRIDSTLHFTYKFNQRPAMGTVILKVQVFDNAGARVTSLRITGDSGMPSMKGAHDSGEVTFSLNKNGDYLLPVSIAMPGDWKIRLKFLRDNKVIYTGDIDFDI